MSRGLSNKTQVIQRLANGYREEEYFRFKLLTISSPQA